jgi:hypothetical protein
MMGASPYGVVLISNQTISDNTAGASSASYSIESDGSANQIKATGGNTELEKWIIPQNGMASHTVRAHQDSGDALDGSSSALDTDLACTSNRTWTIARAGSGSATASLTITVKRGGTTMDTATVNITATVP